MEGDPRDDRQRSDPSNPTPGQAALGWQLRRAKATHRTLHRHVRELGARVHAPEHERHPRLISPRLTNSAKKVAWAKTESSTSTYFAVVMLPSKMGAPTAAAGYFGGSDESARGRYPQQAFSCRFPKHTIVGDAASVPRSPSACQGGSPCRGPAAASTRRSSRPPWPPF